MSASGQYGCLFATGGGLVVLGALNACLALTVDTCTQGSADSLWGFIITLPLYLLGFALAAMRPDRAHLVLPVLVAPIAVWHTAFAARFATGYLQHGIGQCDAFIGSFDQPYFEPSGGEPTLIAGWAAVSIVFWVGTLAMWLRSRRQEPEAT